MLFSEEYDSYIVVSFTNATLVLSIGETVEEVTDSGFLGTSPTLACSRLGEDALIQVYTVCVHVLTADCHVSTDQLMLMDIGNQYLNSSYIQIVTEFSQ